MEQHKKEYDYLVVGSGLFGSIFANKAMTAGKHVLVIDKRPHIGGNCHTSLCDGIIKHDYGAHIFHTSSQKVWEFITRFAQFNNYVHKVKTIFHGKVYSFPINLFTLSQIWKVRNPFEAGQEIEKRKVHIDNPRNLEEWCLSQIGTELYDTFIKGYTTKQWGRSCSELPASIIKRIPIRLNFDDNYFSDTYQGIPIGGYTPIFNKLLSGIEIKCDTDFFKDKPHFEAMATKIVYTGKIDELLGYAFGELEYRSLEFKDQLYHISDFQGGAVVNYTAEDVPWTRSIEHKHFDFIDVPHTIVTREYSVDYKRNRIPYYPIPSEENLKKYQLYRKQAEHTFGETYIFGGRLAEYKYYDMDATIASVLACWEKEEENGSL